MELNVLTLNGSPMIGRALDPRCKMTGGVVQHEVIDTGWAEGLSERIAVTHSGREVVSNRIAGPSVIASGFGNCKGPRLIADAALSVTTCKRTSTGPVLEGVEKSQSGIFSETQHVPAWSNLIESRRIVRGLLNDAAALVILAFYSSNVVSALIRSFVGS